MGLKIERRFLPATDLRATSQGDKRVIEGHAAVFNTLSEDLGGFREQIAPGAFREAIPISDIRFLFNHDPSRIFGRNKAGTLEVAEDDGGLAYRAFPPATQSAQELITAIERGDITQNSFSFTVAEGGDTWQTVGEETIRTILQVAELYDLSAVTYPAYPATDVGVRSAFNSAGLDYDALLRALVRQERKLELRAIDAAVLTAARDVITKLLTPAQTRSGAPGEVRPTPISVLKRRLELAALSI